ncbi:hypothetical protein ABE10_10650, partial [Bacillus toyonensis]|nr:hypothetical protein [Bacillus toyonensis]
GERGPIDRVHGDVAGRATARPDPFAVEEHGRVVLLPFADHDLPVEVDGAEKGAHGVDRSAVGLLLGTAADERDGTDGRGLRRTDELQGEVTVGAKRAEIGCEAHHEGQPRAAARRDSRFCTCVQRKI